MKLYFIDLFCGAGGVTTGLHNAICKGKAVAEVIACVNHDKNAIKSHYENHPQTEHFTEDIRTLDISRLAFLVRRARQMNPGAVICLWASLECTNFSRAKGGLSRDADSRTLAHHLYRYIEGLDPDYIFIENVDEFMQWGPLMQKIHKTTGKKVWEMVGSGKNKKYDYFVDPETGKKSRIPVMVPIPSKKGTDFKIWMDHIKSYGYNYEHRILNSADYGAYTSRKRYFALYAKPGLPITFPAPTHNKTGINKHKWKPVKDVLDFKDEGESILGRKKPLVDKTLARIYAGLIKYVAGGKESFMLKYLSNNARTGTNAGSDLSNPCPTITTQNRLGLVQTKAAFLSKYYSGSNDDKNIPVSGPASALTTIDHHALVQGKFITKYFGKSKIGSIEEPVNTLTTKDRNSLIQTYWLDKQYTNPYNHQSIEQPAGSILSNDKHALVNAKYFIVRQFKSARDQSVEQPAGSIMTVPKMNLVGVKWIMDTNFNNVGSSIDAPAPSILASRRHHYIVNPAYNGNVGDVDNPCCTIVARQDKVPLYLVSLKPGHVAIAVYDFDSEIMIKIKEFMALYDIYDIKMRMLKVPELLRIQGFPSSYSLIGTQSDQKKFIGNSVVPLIPERWVECLFESINQLRNAA